jgi:hypothetical protein
MDPFLIYQWATGKPHVSGIADGYKRFGMMEVQRGLRIEDYIADPPGLRISKSGVTVERRRLRLCR